MDAGPLRVIKSGLKALMRRLGWRQGPSCTLVQTCHVTPSPSIILQIARGEEQTWFPYRRLSLHSKTISGPKHSNLRRIPEKTLRRSTRGCIYIHTFDLHPLLSAASRSCCVWQAEVFKEDYYILTGRETSVSTAAASACGLKRPIL